MKTHTNGRLNTRFCKNLVAAGCTAALACSSAMADDTEVFFGQVDSSVDIFPNVMFVLDTSGSMGAYDGTSQTRLERMQDALDVILDNATNVNVGMMQFNGSYGGGPVLFPITPIDEEMCVSGACGDIHLSRKVRHSLDDAEEAVADGSVIVDENVLSLGNSAARGNEQVGMRFTKIDIPKGATITAAKLKFKADQYSNQSAVFHITAHRANSSGRFSSDINNLSNRDTNSTSVPWVPGSWSQGVFYDSPDISSVIQQVVDRDGWCGGNALSLYIEGTGNRDARSYDKSISDAPELSISYDPTSIPTDGGCMKRTELSQIERGSDDAMEYYWGQMARGNGDIEVPNSYWGYKTMAGFRFNDINIPKNAQITSAKITFEIDEKITGAVDMKITAQNADNPNSFSYYYHNMSSRPQTSPVPWNNVDSPDVDQKLTTPNLKTIAQHLVNKSGWAPGNSMVFFLEKETGNGYRQFDSFEGEQAAAAKLRIQYKTNVSASDSAGYLTARDRLKEVVNDLKATGGTPIVDAYYEAARYMRGEGVDYGKKRGHWGSSKYRVSVPESYKGGSVSRASTCTDADLDHWSCSSEVITGSPKYIAPMASSCQTNHIVFLSDGAATSNSASGKVKTITGVDSCEGSGSQACGAELAEWLYDTDHSSTFSGKQNISTYTIGFNFSGTFLPLLANKGGGSYHEASSSQQLVDVFRSILGDVLSVDTSFVAPGATVNQFNRLTHRSDIYFALFKPAQRATWAGNLKRYKVASNADGKVTILDNTPPNGKPAVDQETGFFAADAVSWWDTIQDGNSVSLGGAAGQMDFANTARRAFTYVGSNSFSGSIDLTASGNTLSENNTNITEGLLKIDIGSGDASARATLRNDILKWARGIDVKDEDADNDTTDSRQHMGDPMHARPVIVNYSMGAADPATTIFVGTNEGYLHAIERDYGQELYSFVPQELLGNFLTFYRNNSSNGHPYGLDGSLSVWTEDLNDNVMVDSGETAMLYTGMRRGGNNYYAFDIANRLNPKLAWVIEGGAGGTAGFEELGQSWSKAVHTKILYNQQVRDVLIFAAGYDENQDPDPAGATVDQTPDAIGRGIFVVDAATGSRLYAISGPSSLGVPDQTFNGMDYSMPTDVRILDVDFDGKADQMYAGDMGGQIWRFDFNKDHTSGNDLVTGGILADLNGNAAQDQRRFYYEPDVALISGEGSQFLSISVGSGWRAHPLNKTVEDRFYVLKSHDIFAPPAGYGKVSNDGTSYVPVTEADLASITDTLEPESNAYGWFFDLPDVGEKVLGDSVTVNNQVIFTTYKPATNVGACTTAIGSGVVYVLNILDGSATIDNNGDGEIDDNDRSKDLAHGGIPPEPAALITESGPTVLVGPEQPVEVPFNNLTQRTFWRDASN